MTELLYIVFAVITGLFLGVFFFGGLWLTVKKTTKLAKPAIWIFGSFLFRMTITVTGFYLISQGNLRRLILCLLGFIVARFMVMYFTKIIEKKQAKLEKEVLYET